MVSNPTEALLILAIANTIAMIISSSLFMAAMTDWIVTIHDDKKWDDWSSVRKRITSDVN